MNWLMCFLDAYVHIAGRNTQRELPTQFSRIVLENCAKSRQVCKLPGLFTQFDRVFICLSVIREFAGMSKYLVFHSYNLLIQRSLY